VAERVGVYPGTFNPPTVAHIAIAAAAREQRSLERVVLVLSRSPINKEHVDRPLFEHRVDVLRAEAARHRWLDVEITDARLLVDIARGYDVLVMGADKWAQVNDAAYYNDDPAARDVALAALPALAIAPRPPFAVPPEHSLIVDAALVFVSSSEARAGSTEWMAPVARAFDRRTGAWSDPDRYEQWLRDGGADRGIKG
jgi:nicotinate-nucleotide adenylyltransferase